LTSNQFKLLVAFSPVQSPYRQHYWSSGFTNDIISIRLTKNTHPFVNKILIPNIILHQTLYAYRLRITKAYINGSFVSCKVTNRLLKIYCKHFNVFLSFCAIYGCRQTSERPLCQYRHVCHESHKHGAAITWLSLIFAAWQRREIPRYGWLTNSTYNIYPLPVFKHNRMFVTCPHPLLSPWCINCTDLEKEDKRNFHNSKTVVTRGSYSLSTRQFITFSKSTTNLQVLT